MFRDDADRWRFLDSLATRVDAFGVVLHQYVLKGMRTCSDCRATSTLTRCVWVT